MLDSRLYNHVDVEVGDLTVSVFHMGATSYALAHNRIPVVPFILVSNAKTAEGSSEPAEVVIRAESNGTLLFDSGPLALTPLAPGKQGIIEPYDQTRVPVTLTREDSLEGPADLSVEVRVGEENVVKQIDFRVLADNEWFNSPSYYESLAAFVQPNAAAVVPVLSAAADILQKETGDASLSGYQAGPQRVLEITGAVYQALQSADIRYINPPASFENTGQRIRSSSDVLESRFGTCIDLSLTFAAVAEQCGLHPVIIMVPGHAMAGVLMTEDPLPAPVLLEDTAINNYLRSGRVLPIDAMFYNDMGFRQVVDRSRAALKDKGAQGLIDVKSAHRNGMRPLPYRTAPKTEEERLIDASKSTWDLPDTGLISDISETAFRDDTDESPARVQAWKRELLDLSLRNRLLNVKKGPEVLDFLLPEDTLADLDDKIHAGEKIAIHPSDDVSDNRRMQGIHRVTQLPNEQLAGDLIDRNRLYADVSGARYDTYFRSLTRLVRTYTEETGSANLYLTLGALVHTNTTGKPAYSPLFLIPVKIVGGKGRARYQIQVDTSVEASPNYSLVEWLRQVHGVTIEALSKPKLDDSGLDIEYALSQISEALVKAELPFTVIEKSRLIIAKFSTYGMWKDLQNNWSDFMGSPVFNHITTKAGAQFSDPAAVGPSGEAIDIRDVQVKEAELALPIPADGAQLKAITAAAAGYSFVLEGPPGTGKSQTITNLIAHALDKGKKVLFVAEKQAALDVVQERLARVGLAPFTLDLHGVEQKPAAIKKQLKDSIDAEVYYGAHAWETAVSDLRTRLAPLSDYPGQIHDLNGVDHSLWSATTTLMDMGDGPTATIPESFVANPALSLNELRNIAADLSPLAKIMDFSAVDRWRLTGSELRPTLIKRWAELEKQRRIVSRASGLVPHLERDDLDDFLRTLEEAEKIPEDQRLSPEQIDRLTHTPESVKALAAEINSLGQELAQAQSLFSPAFIRSGDTAPILEAIAETRRGMFGKKKRMAAYEQALRIAVPANAAELDLEGAFSPDQIEIQLGRLPQLRAAATELQAKLEQIPGAEPMHARSVLDPALPAALWQFGEDIVEAIVMSRKHEDALQILDDLSSSGLADDMSTTLRDIRTAWLDWVRALGSTDDSIHDWRGNNSWVIAWLTTANAWKRDIDSSGAEVPSRITQWSTATADLRTAGLSEFVGQIERGEIPPNDIDVALRRGIAQASVTERGTYFRLDDFHSELKDNELAQLTAAIAKVQEESVRALPAKLLRQRPFRPDRLDGRPALLRRQLDAKRNAKSFRNLLQEFGDEILSVAPCFFVSPASLATYVAPGAVDFDIVVFDEASQVTVDQAMGALGRGRSAVIVGDSKQMPPTRIGKAVATNEDDPDSDDDMADIADLESILSEAVESGLPQVWLSWHYRSKDEALIAFSNEHYYEGNLSSLPSPGFIPDAGVSVTRVDGQFIREQKHPLLRTNPVEAEAIVQSVVKRINNPVTGHESIGVVTFNMPQRNLVLDLLEQSDDPLVQKRLQPGPDSIFVKNLENVQGDERDVILFSTAFSKHESGKAMPMNFGPLSRAGGERRLNVAVTRARKEVEVFCSFDPNEIDVSRTKSVGMAHLRAYLEAAIETPSLPDASLTPTGLNINPVRDHIAARLQDRGWVVEKDFGLSSFTLDLVVRPADDDRWHAAILTDGQKWAAMPTVADRDLTPNLLGAIMEWAATVRVWLPEWIKNPDAVIERIEASLADASSRINDLDQQRAEALAEAERVLAEERKRIEDERLAEEAAQEQARAELEAEQAEEAELAGASSVGASEIDATDVAERTEENRVAESGEVSSDEDAAPEWKVEDEWTDLDRAAETLTGTSDNPFDAPAPKAQPASVPAVATAPSKPRPQDPNLFDSSATPEAAAFRGSLGMLNILVGGETCSADSSPEAPPALPTEVPFAPVSHDIIGEREELEAGFEGERAEQVRAEVLLMLEDHAPMRLDTLQSAIAKRFGRQKTSRKMNETVINPLLPSDHIHDEHGVEFIWPTATGPSDWNHYRRSEGRNVVDISIHEVANAAKIVLAEYPDLSATDPNDTSQLYRQILAVFGVTRLTTTARTRIFQALELL